MAKRIKLENFEQTFNRKLTAAEAYANRPRFWVLYTFITLIVVAMVSWSSSGIQFNGLTVQGTEVAKGVLHGIFGPDTKLLFGTGDTDVPYLLLQTMAIAILGTLIGAILASSNINHSVPVVGFFRFVLALIRTLPTLVIALVCALIFSLGTFSGTVAIAVFTFGVVSKMMYEAIETIDMGAFEAMESAGGDKFQSFRVACFPQILPTYLSYCLYSLEMNIRAAAILGYVGAGGLGLLINERIGWRDYEGLGMVLLALFVVVFIIENTSQYLRKKLS